MIYILFIYLIYFWLCWVLDVGSVIAPVHGLFVVVHGLLSTCGVQVFSSLVVAHRLQGTWALQLWHVGSRARGVCSLQHMGSS